MVRTVFVLLITGAFSSLARAVPIPFLNCGAPGDSLHLTQYNASVYPPSVAAPGDATATFDAAGNLIDLQIHFVYGLSWTFDSGPLPTTTSAGFVSLPASFPVSVTSPSLPVAAGPYTTTETFNGIGTSVAIVSKANIATTVDAPLTATAGLSSNGTPGFPLAGAAGNVYQVHVQMSASGGEVFCATVNIPLTTASPFVSVQGVPDAPTLSMAGLIALALMLLATGALAGRRRVRAHLRTAHHPCPRPPIPRGLQAKVPGIRGDAIVGRREDDDQGHQQDPS